MIVAELPFVTSCRAVVHTVLDNIIALDRVACAPARQVEARVGVVLHPVAGDIVVVCIVEVDAEVVVRVSGVARERVVVARRRQLDAAPVVLVSGSAR